MSRVSLALCIARERSRTVLVCDCEQSVHDLDDADAPAFALLDDLATAGEPPWQVVALDAEGQLYADLAAQVLASLPAPPAGASQDQIALHDVRMKILQPLLAPWLDHARERLAEVDRRATAHPELATNATAATAVRDSRQRLAQLPHEVTSPTATATAADE